MYCSNFSSKFSTIDSWLFSEQILTQTSLVIYWISGSIIVDQKDVLFQFRPEFSIDSCVFSEQILTQSNFLGNVKSSIFPFNCLLGSELNCRRSKGCTVPIPNQNFTNAWEQILIQLRGRNFQINGKRIGCLFMSNCLLVDQMQAVTVLNPKSQILEVMEFSWKFQNAAIAKVWSTEWNCVC